MAQYRLYCIGASGNSYKVALYLNCAGLDWEPVGVNFAGGETRDAAWRAANNAMGEVPVLEVAGRRMSQSGAILTWLAETTGKFAVHPDDRFEALRWMFFDNHKFTNNYAMHRFQRCFTPQPVHESVLAFLHARVEACFAVAEKHLSDRRFMLLNGGLRVLPAGGNRLRHRERVSGDRRLAQAPCRAAGLETAVRDDAGWTRSAGAQGVGVPMPAADNA
jgi:glutathione S-transferase